MRDDGELLRLYLEGNEEAFAELVRGHVDLVHGAATRLTGGDAAAAQDITQTVFLHLSRRAEKLRNRPTVTGWLYETTRCTAANFRRAKYRRETREREAAFMNETGQEAGPELDWNRIRPLLDDALASLSESSRQAVLLRFFERHDFKTTGELLGLTEDAARMRVGRAVEKLRGYLQGRGLTLAAAPLAAALAAEGAPAAPVGLAATVSGSIAAGAAATAFGWIGATTTTMNLKTILAAALGVVLASTALYQQHETLRRLEAEQAGFRQRVKAAQGLRETRERLARLQAAKEELDQLRGEHEQLGQLRQEYAALRQRKVKEAKERLAAAVNRPRASELAESSPGPFFAAFTTHLAPGQTLLSGGWGETNGCRAFLLLTPRTDSSSPSAVTFKVILADINNTNLPAFAGFLQTSLTEPINSAPDSLTTSGRKSVLQRFLNADQTEALMQYLKKTEGSSILTGPMMSVADGRKGEVTVGEPKEVTSPSFQLTGRINPDDGGVDVDLDAQFGYLDPSAPVPAN